MTSLGMKVADPLANGYIAHHGNMVGLDKAYVHIICDDNNLVADIRLIYANRHCYPV